MDFHSATTERTACDKDYYTHVQLEGGGGGGCCCGASAVYSVISGIASPLEHLKSMVQTTVAANTQPSPQRQIDPWGVYMHCDDWDEVCIIWPIQYYSSTVCTV